MEKIMRLPRPFVSVVITVKNDPAGVKVLLLDLAKQTLRPDEVIVIRAEDYQNCNRAIGRNIGIKKARNNIIAVTDVGCRPHPNWLTKITQPFKNDKDLLAVAGFYHVLARTSFQKAITPYLSVKWSKNYLPASRSIAFTKSAWKKVNGYPENATSGAEDLEFARKLKADSQIKIIQQSDALVDWEPPITVSEFFHDMVKHTLGNFEIGYWPHILRNLTVLARWLIFVVWPQFIFIYLVLTMGKLRRLGKLGKLAGSRDFLQIILWLPIVQIVSDMAIIIVLFHIIRGGAVWGHRRILSLRNIVPGCNTATGPRPNKV